jgi:hypothetical protein
MQRRSLKIRRQNLHATIIPGIFCLLSDEIFNKVLIEADLWHKN